MRGRVTRLGAAALWVASAASCSGEPEAGRSESARRLVTRLRDSGAIAEVVTSRTTRPVRVDVPERAGGALRVEDGRSGIGVDVEPLGVRDVRGESADGAVVYRDAYGANGHLVRVRGSGAVEDLAVFARRPSAERLNFRVDVSRVAGLRLVGDALELLDGAGAPRLRVSPPWLVDGRGERRRARLAVRGCAYDADPRAPWGRAVVRPGAASCELAVDWSASGAVYPVVVDPVWNHTGSLTQKRSSHTATLLGDGRVLVAGGDVGPAWNSVLSYCELYDPASRSFAMTGSLGAARARHASARLGSGKVLAAGGRSSAALSSAELYDPATGTWSATGAMTVGRDAVSAVGLSDGKVLALGAGSADVYDPATGAWTPTAGAPVATREEATATLLKTGEVLVAGGAPGPAELFDPTTGRFAATGTMSKPHRTGTSASLLPGGRVLVAGGEAVVLSGSTASVERTTSAELYDPTTGQWSDAAPMATARADFGAATLASGKVLVAGGQQPAGVGLDRVTANAELFDPATGQWSSLPPLYRARSAFTATTLGNGTVLVAGGVVYGPDIYAPVTSEAEVLELLPLGAACAEGDDCVSGFCADGVCCDRACGACESCSAAKKGGGADGVCAPHAAGTDPDSDCAPEPASTCGTTGVCDGNGACAKHAAGAVCVPASCAAAAVTVSTCDGAGSCQPTTSNCAPYGCRDEQCRTTCDVDEHCAPGARCDAATHRCLGGATCDGAHTLTETSGATVDCAPYACEGSSCKEQCVSVRDCAAGFVCADDGACVTVDGGAASGCDVASSPASERTALLLAALGAGVAVAGRRRRMER